MIKSLKKSLLAAFFVAAAGVPTANAQLGNLDQVLSGGVADANYLLGEYMKPFADGFGSSLNTGWIQSAQPHGFLPIPGFHVRLSVQSTLIPADNRSFMIDESRLTSLKIRNGVMETPTISGKKNADAASFAFKNDPTNTKVFDMPTGLGVPAAASPMIQAGIGLPKKTQLMVRYVPQTELALPLPRGKFEIGTIGLWGVGLQHEVLQYIPIAKRIPLLNMSVVGGYTNYSMSKNLSGGGDKKLEWTTAAWNANLIAGLTTPFIKILSVYAGAGIEGANSTLKMKGTYAGIPEEDPINLEMKSDPALRYLAGLRFKLSLITFNAEVTRSTFDTATIGFGLSFR
jgi:hypothetical protein